MSRRTILKVLSTGERVPQRQDQPIIRPVVHPRRTPAPSPEEFILEQGDPLIRSLPQATPEQIARSEARAAAMAAAAIVPPREHRANPWLDHVKEVRSELPAGTKYKDVLKRAAETYMAAEQSARVPSPKKVTIKKWDGQRPRRTIHINDDANFYIKSQDDSNPGTLVRIRGAGVLDIPGVEVDVDINGGSVCGGALIERGWNDQGKRLLDGYGDWQIVGIRVQRAPVQEFVTKLLNVVTAGGYSQAVRGAGYDQMMHLGHVLTLRRADGSTKRLILEKNETVNLSDRIPTEKDMEYLDVSVPSPFKSLNEYVKTTLDRIGSGAFFLYDAKNRNCQRFIADCLRSNGVLTPPIEAWIVQDASSIFSKLPGLKEFARVLTDLGAAAAHVKDEVVEFGKDVASGTKQAAKAISKQAKKTGRRIRKTLGFGLADGLTLHTVLIPRERELTASRQWIRDHGLSLEHAHRYQKNFIRFRQIPPEQFDQESFVTYHLTEDPAVMVVMGRLK